MEQEPKSTYEHATDFYEKQIGSLTEHIQMLPQCDVWARTTALDELEIAQLKLLQTQRRHELGLLK